MSEPEVKRYIISLSADERERLEAPIHKGKHPAARVLRARILLKAEVSEAGFAPSFWKMFNPCFAPREAAAVSARTR